MELVLVMGGVMVGSLVVLGGKAEWWRLLMTRRG